MNPADTSLGGGKRAFPDTAWSLVVRLGASQSGEYRDGLDMLCRQYWKPVYRYVRIAWARTNEDAKDLTQAFFVWLTEDDALRRYAPERGGFRAYLKVLLKRFVGHQIEALQRLKRGGGVKIVPIDEDLPPAAAGEDPERAFDAEWLNELVGHAIARVRERFSASGRAAQIRVFEEYDLRPATDQPSYADVAERLGMKTTDVRNHLFAVREAVREEIRAELAQMTSDAQELEEEYRALFGS
jgi:RNA polymerase sigma-70 factor (ECF subfamily)